MGVNIFMKKPTYYDGSDLPLTEEDSEDPGQSGGLEITDERRSRIGRNPYFDNKID